MLLGSSNSKVDISSKSEDYFYPYKTLPDYLSFPPINYNPQSSEVPLDEQESSLDGILNSKKNLLIDKMGMLKAALYERKAIKEDVVNYIEADLSKCQNHIFQVEGKSYFSFQKDWEQKRFDLWKELRQEQVSYFRDLQMLHQEIRDTEIEYIQEKQTEELFK